MSNIPPDDDSHPENDKILDSEVSIDNVRWDDPEVSVSIMELAQGVLDDYGKKIPEHQKLEVVKTIREIKNMLNNISMEERRKEYLNMLLTNGLYFMLYDKKALKNSLHMMLDQIDQNYTNSII